MHFYTHATYVHHNMKTIHDSVCIIAPRVMRFSAFIMYHRSETRYSTSQKMHHSCTKMQLRNAQLHYNKSYITLYYVKPYTISVAQNCNYAVSTKSVITKVVRV